MITKNTTLILGAGASIPYGFPNGYDLVDSVLRCARDHASKNKSAHPEYLKQVTVFINALAKSGSKSIDAFLENRAEFINFGKYCIAESLIPFENEDLLFRRTKDNWYEYLFGRLNSRFEDFNKNKISILTFNYDRSLEHYLLTTLKNSHNKHDMECARILKQINIVHLHGDLGGIPFMDNFDVRHYNTENDPSALHIATNRIRIIHEGGQNEVQFKQAHSILSTSSRICFLGFGYHPINMKRLGFEESNINQGTSYPNAEVMGSTYGMTDAECIDCTNRYGFDPRIGKHGFRNLDVLQYIREMGVLF